MLLEDPPQQTLEEMDISPDVISALSPAPEPAPPTGGGTHSSAPSYPSQASMAALDFKGYLNSRPQTEREGVQRFLDQAPDPEYQKKILTNVHFLAEQLQAPVWWVNGNYDKARAAFSATRPDIGDAWKDVNALHGYVVNRATKERDLQWLISGDQSDTEAGRTSRAASMDMFAVDAARAGTQYVPEGTAEKSSAVEEGGKTEAFARWQAKAKAQKGYDPSPEAVAGLWQRFSSIYDSEAEVSREAAVESRAITGLLDAELKGKAADFEKNKSFFVDPAQYLTGSEAVFDEISARLQTLKPAVRNAVLLQINNLPESKDRASLAGDMDKAFIRGTGAMGRKIGNVEPGEFAKGVAESINPVNWGKGAANLILPEGKEVGAKKPDPERLKQAGTERDKEQLIQALLGKYTPPDTSTNFRQAMVGAAEIGPSMAMSAIPVVGPAVLAATYQRDAENSLLLKGVNPETASQMSFIVGGLQAAADRFQFKFLTKWPGVKAGMAKLEGAALAGSLKFPIATFAARAAGTAVRHRER